MNLKSPLLKWLLIGTCSIFILLVVGFFALNYYLTKDIQLPPYQKVAVEWTDQNWKPADWNWFYHVSQGTAFEFVIPYDWFLALERPELSLGELGRFVEPSYIERFGFLPSEVDGGKLPVGFAVTENYTDPNSGATVPKVVGFTCAACHTGQLNYQGRGVRIDGGSAMIELDKFRKAIGTAILITHYDCRRFDRFAARVLKDRNTSEERAKLKHDLKEIIVKGLKLRKMNEDRGLYPVTEGFGRLDALGRIGNFVFGTEFVEAGFEGGGGNMLPADAPVHFPRIWHSAWFDWVQYNASIKQPMTRNAGEAMGVFARVNFKHDSKTPFQSTINISNLYEIEQKLRGGNVFEEGAKPSFKGLDSPKWPAKIFGNIDQDKARRGQAVYVQNCQHCHLPPPTDEAFFADEYWTKKDEHGFKYLNLNLINLAEIGTDGKTASNWYEAVVDLGPLGTKASVNKAINLQMTEYTGYKAGGSITPAAVALPVLVELTTRRKYDEWGKTQKERDEINGNRPNEVRAPLAYKARPLSGVWATPPYLHNGSVASIYELLLPAHKRATTVYLGSKEYDPVKLGYVQKEIPGGFALTPLDKHGKPIPGNRNAGHEFKGERKNDQWRSLGSGVIGPELREDERMELIEFIKTL